MTNARNKKQVVIKKKKTKTVNVRAAKPAEKQAHGARLANRYVANPLALALSNPADHSAIRFPTSDMARTSTAAFKYQHSITTNVMTGNTAITGFPADSVLVAVVGQPALTHSVYGAIPATPNALRFKYLENGVLVDTMLCGNFVATGNNSVDLRPEYAYATAGGIGPRGDDYLPIGEADGYSYFFANRGDLVVVIPAPDNDLNNGIIKCEIYRHNPNLDGENYAASFTATYVGGTFTNFLGYLVPQAGFYRVATLEVSNTGGMTARASLIIELQRPPTTGWVHYPCYDLYAGAQGDPEIGRNVRCNATSLLVSNTTAPLTRSGTILAGRVMGQDWLNASYSALEKCAEKYTGPAAHGAYTFMEFTRPREEFISVCEGAASAMPRYMLGRKDFVHLISVSSAPASPNTYTATLATHVEFKTDVARYAKGVSGYGFAELLAARALINSNPEWFYENPTHMEKIYQFLRSGFRAAQKHAGPISGLASSIDPARAPLYALLAQMMK